MTCSNRTRALSCYGGAICLAALWLLAACGPILGAQARQEIGAFMADYIVQEKIIGAQPYPAPGTPPIEAGGKVYLIVWAETPPAQGQPPPPLKALATWRYANGVLTDMNQPQKALEDYQREFMENPGPEGWGYYEFTIESIADDGLSAQVLLRESCGPMCGAGFRLTLERVNGQWRVTQSKMLWQT